MNKEIEVKEKHSGRFFFFVLVADCLPMIIRRTRARPARPALFSVLIAINISSMGGDGSFGNRKSIVVYNLSSSLNINVVKTTTAQTNNYHYIGNIDIPFSISYSTVEL